MELNSRQPPLHLQPWVGVLLWTLLCISGPSSTLGDSLVFVDVTEEAGLDYEHGLGDLPLDNASAFSGGVAAGDVDRDGYVDLFVVRGGLGTTQLWRNNGQGGFHEIGADLGLDLDDPRLVAPLLADTNGDGWLDLALGGIQEAPLRLLRNDGGDAFVDITGDLGLFSTRNNLSSAMADYDRDGDLDWVVAHWSTDGGGANHLWRNDGEVFSPVDWRVGIAPLYLDTDWTFTPIFSDLDGDGWPELLMASDFGTSRVFRNVPDDDPPDRLFVLDTRSDFTDENGMGAAVGDMDNDGDMDWFVSSIWDADGTPEGNWGITGNRLYRNQNGRFDDISESAGVRPGDWGWGSCFGDFNLDGWLDIFHTNGFQGSVTDQFLEDPVRLFLNRGDGTFDEQAAVVGLDDTGLGRGVVCFDYDRDGDLDLFIANHSGPPKLYRNDLLSPGTQKSRWLSVALQDNTSANVHGVGARVTVIAGDQTQVREIRCGSNYLSQDPSEAHFGLGGTSIVESLHVLWPDGGETTYDDVAINRHLVLRRGGPEAIDIPVLNGWGWLAWISALGWAGWRRLRPVT